MLRSVLKTTTACAMSWTGVDALMHALTDSGRWPLVLGYHRVVTDLDRSARNSIPSMLISDRTLERHLDWLARRFRFVSLDELGSRLERGERIDGRSVSITFDDGYRDFYDRAFPILRRKGIPAAVFVVTDLVGTERLQVYDELYLLLRRSLIASPEARGLIAGMMTPLRPGHAPVAPRNVPADPQRTMTMLLAGLPQATIRELIRTLAGEFPIAREDLEGLLPLGWEALAEMRREGITIGSHSRTHALLTAESRRVILDQVFESRVEIERRLGAPVLHFAYPDGRFDAEVVDAVASSGYRFGYTVCGHRDRRHPLLTIPRRLLWERATRDVLGRFSPAIMSCHAHGVLDFISPCEIDHRPPASRPVTPIRGSAPAPSHDVARRSTAR